MCYLRANNSISIRGMLLRSFPFLPQKMLLLIATSFFHIPTTIHAYNLTKIYFFTEFRSRHPPFSSYSSDPVPDTRSGRGVCSRIACRHCVLLNTSNILIPILYNITIIFRKKIKQKEEAIRSVQISEKKPSENFIPLVLLYHYISKNNKVKFYLGTHISSFNHLFWIAKFSCSLIEMLS